MLFWRVKRFLTKLVLKITKIIFFFSTITCFPFSRYRLHLKSTLDMCPLISQNIIFSCSVWSHLNWEKSKFLSSLLARGKINIRRRWNVINKLEKIGCSLEMNLLPFANSYKIKISTSKKFTLHPNKTSSSRKIINSIKLQLNLVKMKKEKICKGKLI